MWGGGGVCSRNLSVQSVKKSVTSTIRGSSTTGGLSSLTKVQGLTTEGTLVDLTVLGTRERDTIVLQLVDSLGGLSAHVLNGILVTQPIRTLNGVISMPPPVILGHVTKSSVDTTLGSDCVRTSGEQLGDAGRLETRLSQTHSSTKTSTTGTNNDGIVVVVNNVVSLRSRSGLRGGEAFGEGSTLRDTAAKDRRGKHFPWKNANHKLTRSFPQKRPKIFGG